MQSQVESTQHVMFTCQVLFLHIGFYIEMLQVEVALWDTAGQERFHSLAPLYYRDADAALLVCTLSFLD